MIRPCANPLFCFEIWKLWKIINVDREYYEWLRRTITGGSTTVIVSSSIKYITFTYRIRSYERLGSTMCWRKYPLNVRTMLSLRTYFGRNGGTCGFFMIPYVNIGSYLQKSLAMNWWDTFSKNKVHTMWHHSVLHESRCLLYPSKQTLHEIHCLNCNTVAHYSWSESDN